MSNELIVIEELKPEIVFSKGGATPIIEGIKQRALSIVLDVTTEKGRDDIRSIAYKIARSKTALDNMGKEVKDEWKKKTDEVDAERKKIRDELEALQERVRKPLTDFEDKEKERVKAHEDLIAKIEALEVYAKPNDSGLFYTVLEIVDAFEEVSDIVIEHNGEEFTDKINYTLKSMKEKLDQAILKREKYDDEQEELRLLREKQLEQARIDRERLVAEAAKREAEEKAKAEAERVRLEAEKREADLKAKELLAIAEAERLKNEAIERENALLAEKKLAEDRALKAENDAKLAAEKAKADAEQAALLAKQKADAEAEARENDANIRKRVNNEILESLLPHVNMDKELAKNITIAMVRGEIKNVTIKY